MATLPKPFNPRNWYWAVNGSTTQVYSSAVGNYVPVDNAAYQAWIIATGRTAQNIDTEANLGGVLATHSLRPTPAAILDGYTESQAVKLTIETVAKILFNHENRIRTLAGQPTVTAAQFKAFIKSQM
jgi:hypothetical protein